MAKAKSVILTPAEKKSIIVELRNKVKEADAAIKLAKTAAKNNDNELAAANKAAATAMTSAAKAHTAAAKAITKNVEATEKVAAKLKEQLTALTAPVPVTPAA